MEKNIWSGNVFLSGICCTCCSQKHQNAHKYKYKISLWNVLHVVVIVNVKESVFFISSFSEQVGDKYQPIFYCHTWAKLLDLSINFDADSLFTNQTKFFHTRKHCFKSRHCILQPGLFSWSPTNHHGPIEWYFSRRPLWHLSQTKFCSIMMVCLFSQTSLAQINLKFYFSWA